MTFVKIVGVLLIIYVGIVVAFESLIGFFQPGGQTTLVITTTDEDGDTNDRVLSRLQSDGKTYVAVNHWPRAWYGRALDNPNVSVTMDGEKGSYLVVPLEAQEQDRVDREHSLGFVVRLLTGFPPRYIVRLDPQ